MEDFHGCFIAVNGQVCIADLKEEITIWDVIRCDKIECISYLNLPPFLNDFTSTFESWTDRFLRWNGMKIKNDEIIFYISFNFR